MKSFLTVTSEFKPGQYLTAFRSNHSFVRFIIIFLFLQTGYRQSFLNSIISVHEHLFLLTGISVTYRFRFIIRSQLLIEIQAVHEDFDLQFQSVQLEMISAISVN